MGGTVGAMRTCVDLIIQQSENHLLRLAFRETFRRNLGLLIRDVLGARLVLGLLGTSIQHPLNAKAIRQLAMVGSPHHVLHRTLNDSASRRQGDKETIGILASLGVERNLHQRTRLELTSLHARNVVAAHEFQIADGQAPVEDLLVIGRIDLKFSHHGIVIVSLPRKVASKDGLVKVKGLGARAVKRQVQYRPS
jgi:hypothetical protein